MYIGPVLAGDTLIAPVQTVNTSSVPINADAAPRRIVRNLTTGARIDAAAGQASQGHTGSVTDATNASPIVITSASHGLQSGCRVTVVNVGGNTAANGTFNVTKVDDNSFSLDGSTGNGTYTSGGTWNLAGYYQHSISIDANFSAGDLYEITSMWLISASARTTLDTFTVS